MYSRRPIIAKRRVLLTAALFAAKECHGHPPSGRGNGYIIPGSGRDREACGKLPKAVCARRKSRLEAANIEGCFKSAAAPSTCNAHSAGADMGVVIGSVHTGRWLKNCEKVRFVCAQRSLRDIAAAF